MYVLFHTESIVMASHHRHSLGGSANLLPNRVTDTRTIKRQHQDKTIDMFRGGRPSQPRSRKGPKLAAPLSGLLSLHGGTRPLVLKCNHRRTASETGQGSLMLQCLGSALSNQQFSTVFLSFYTRAQTCRRFQPFLFRPIPPF